MTSIDLFFLLLAAFTSGMAYAVHHVARHQATIAAVARTKGL